MSRIEQIVNDAFLNGYHPQQRRSEILTLARILEADKPQSIVEVGSAEGGSLYIFSRVSQPNATIYSFDINPEGLRRDGLVLEGQRLVQFLPKKEPYDPIERVDFLFIDGDHKFESVANDFETYSPLVKPGGLIGFHDILPSDHPECHVEKFWKLIRHKFQSVEIVEGGRTREMGIGLIWV